MANSSTETNNAERVSEVADSSAFSSDAVDVSPNADLAITDLMAELDQVRNRELRAQAELENYRKRAARDLEQQIKFANASLVRDLLDVVDNLQRAALAAESAQESSSLLQGVRLVQQQFTSVLSKYQCFPIEAVGQPFDPNFHEAISQVPSEQPAGTVVHQASIGYRMYDRVIRPSQVIVSSGPMAS